MNAAFLDTNIFIRHLTNDDPIQSAKAYHLFKDIEAGKTKVVTSHAVIVETVQVLSSKKLYNLPRETVRDLLTPILMLPGLKVEPLKMMVIKALHMWAASNVDFVDTLIVAYMQREQIQTIVSFDHDFDDFPGITRKEPPLARDGARCRARQRRLGSPRGLFHGKHGDLSPPGLRVRHPLRSRAVPADRQGWLGARISGNLALLHQSLGVCAARNRL